MGQSSRGQLTPFGRRLLVDRVHGGWTPAQAAEAAGVSRQTVYRWLRRFEQEGAAGLDAELEAVGVIGSGSHPDAPQPVLDRPRRSCRRRGHPDDRQVQTHAINPGRPPSIYLLSRASRSFQTAGIAKI